MEDEVVDERYGNMQRYSAPFSVIIAKQLDGVLLRNQVFRCRGHLMRNSLKYRNKWQICFYMLDILLFTSVKAEKILRAFVKKGQIFRE